jgi:hypothetical protein
MTIDIDGELFVVDDIACRIVVFGMAPTPTHSMRWGRLKAMYK